MAKGLSQLSPRQLCSMYSAWLQASPSVRSRNVRERCREEMSHNICGQEASAHTQSISIMFLDERKNATYYFVSLEKSQ